MCTSTAISQLEYSLPLVVRLETSWEPVTSWETLECETLCWVLKQRKVKSEMKQCLYNSQFCVMLCLDLSTPKFLHNLTHSMSWFEVWIRKVGKSWFGLMICLFQYLGAWLFGSAMVLKVSSLVCFRLSLQSLASSYHTGTILMSSHQMLIDKTCFQID